MKIIFISGVKFGHNLLEYILKKNWKIETIFSYSDSKKNQYSDFVSFDDLSKKYGIKNMKINQINDPKNINEIKLLQPDLILVMGWSQLLNSEIIKIPTIGIIGSHPTELPKYRGRAPIPWTILKGLKESALTFFWIEEGIDNGYILDQKKFLINEMDDATSLYDKITSIGKQMLHKNLIQLKKGIYTKLKQNESDFIEYWEKRTPDDGKIHWNMSSLEIHSLIRASTHPYPGAFTFFNNKKLIIWSARYSNEKSFCAGKIMEVTKDYVKIGAGTGVIFLDNISYDNLSNISVSKVFSTNHVGFIME